MGERERDMHNMNAEAGGGSLHGKDSHAGEEKESDRACGHAKDMLLTPEMPAAAGVSDAAAVCVR